MTGCDAPPFPHVLLLFWCSVRSPCEHVSVIFFIFFFLPGPSAGVAFFFPFSDDRKGPAFYATCDPKAKRAAHRLTAAIRQPLPLIDADGCREAVGGAIGFRVF